MMQRAWLLALGMAVAASSAAASHPRLTGPAPMAGPGARYCLYVEAATGTRLERVQCWTRAEWADLEVDVDHDWAEEGVAVLP